MLALVVLVKILLLSTATAGRVDHMSEYSSDTMTSTILIQS